MGITIQTGKRNVTYKSYGLVLIHITIMICDWLHVTVIRLPYFMHYFLEGIFKYASYLLNLKLCSVYNVHGSMN
jgi:hypothetical protein